MKASRPLALVTGARRGIGASIALQLAQEGFDIALTDVSNEGAQLVVEAAQAHGARAAFFESNLIHAETHQALIEQAVAWGGPIACLVNNAGIGAPSRGDLLDVTTNAFDVVLGVNLRGTFFLTQTVARHMLTASNTAPRSIITVSSVSAEMASIERGEYCISKAGLSMLTKLFALRLAEQGIGVFEVRPGVIRTPLTAAVAAKYDRRIAEGLVPMGRWGETEDVANTVAVLAAGRMNFATGSVLNVDGGLSIQRF
jgi:NAD(P)-dependent dehydrogenase (short-subunit alcohol dehydrogenase family)